MLLHNKKTEYKNYTDNVHIHSALQLYKGKKGENPNFGYYELPTLADSGRQEVIRFKKYTDNYEEILLEKFADIVYMEINRIKKIRERYRRFNLKPNEQGYLNPALHRIKKL